MNWKHGRKRWVKVAVVVTCLFVCNLMLYRHFLGGTSQYPPSFVRHVVPFLVDTSACKIPNVDPFDSSIRQFVGKIGSITCSNIARLTYQDGLQLRINWTVANGPPHHGNVHHCIYTPIYRPKHVPTSNNHWEYLNDSEAFNDSVAITDEFVRVFCYNAKEEKVYTNVHPFIQPNVTVDDILKQRFEEHKENNTVEHPNLIMLGVDSVSRLSCLRQLTKTRQFLTESLEAVDMMGYNKVDDNTFVNIIPMTVGKFIAELPWDEKLSKKPFDDVNFIWKQYSQKAGYTTFYAEDAPGMSIFDYEKVGFNTPPTDYFNRPLSVAMERMKELWTNSHSCFQGKLETDIILDNLYDFIDTPRSTPYFAFTFITRLTHDNVNGAGAADESYYSFFKNLHDNGLLNNTVIFFFSDHGMRFGKFRQTHIGKLEERLPFMWVSVPKSWSKYPYVKHNLKINSNRLSTPFDVYETLRDILYFTGVQQEPANNSRGVSWFREIPIERSCDQAGILAHWCTCMSYEKLNTNDKLVKKTGSILVAEIVHQLTNYTDICEDLSLFEIKEAARLVTSDDILKLQKVSYGKKYFEAKTKLFEDIQLMIVTSPGNAMFEGTVRVNTESDTSTIVGDISRVNKYGHNADCIPSFKLKKFCQCREDIEYSVLENH